MAKKTMMATAIVLAVVGLAVPAGAAAAPSVRTAKLTTTTSTARAASATVGWTGSKWYGHVAVKAGALAPGNYVFGVLLQTKDLNQATGDVLCSFTITTAGTGGGCRGISKHLTKGIWRAFSYAQVYPSFGGSPVLEGLLH